MPQVTLFESAQVTLDSNGNGALAIGPTNSAQTWTPTQINVQVTSNVKEPLFKYYKGRTAGNLSFLGGTSTGSNDQSDVSGQILYPGESFYCVWTGGDANAVASVSLNGTMSYD